MAVFYKYEYTNKTKNIHPWPKVQSICSRIEKERFQKELTQTWHSEPPPDCDSPTNQGKEVVSLGQTQIVYPDIQEFSESNTVLLRAGLLVCHQVPVRKTCLLQRLDRLYQQVFRNFTWQSLRCTLEVTIGGDLSRSRGSWHRGHTGKICRNQCYKIP